MYTFKFSDSETLSPATKEMAIFSFLEFHQTTPKNIMIAQIKGSVLAIMVSNREEKT